MPILGWLKMGRLPSGFPKPQPPYHLDGIVRMTRHVHDCIHKCSSWNITHNVPVGTLDQFASPKKPQSRAGWPGCFLWNWFGQSFDGRSRMSKSGSSRRLPWDFWLTLVRRPTPGIVAPRSLKSRLSLSPIRAAGSPARTACSAYITSARFSSSYCNTGRAHPAISTRPAASRAALGDTP
jgi:hypothetical protein